MVIKYKINKSNNIKFPIVVYSTSCDSPINYIGDLEKDLNYYKKKIAKHKKIIYDLEKQLKKGEK